MDATKLASLMSDVNTAAKMILESDLAVNMSARGRERLQTFLGPERQDCFFAEIYDTVDGVDYGTHATIEFRWESAYDSKVRDDGGVWRTYRTRCAVNYPSHGAMQPAAALKRVQHLVKVAELATAIENATTREHYVCIRTADEQVAYLAEQTRRENEATVNRTLNDAADVVRRGMRVGYKARRDLPKKLIEGVPVGTYSVTRWDYNGKVAREYSIVVSEYSSYIKRIN